LTTDKNRSRGSSIVGMGSSPSGCAMKLVSLDLVHVPSQSHLLRYPFKHRSFLEDEGREGNSGQIRTRPQLRDDVGEHCTGQPGTVQIAPSVSAAPLLCSGSTTVVSSSSPRDSSIEDRPFAFVSTFLIFMAGKKWYF